MNGLNGETSLEEILFRRCMEQEDALHDDMTKHGWKQEKNEHWKSRYYEAFCTVYGAIAEADLQEKYGAYLRRRTVASESPFHFCYHRKEG